MNAYDNLKFFHDEVLGLFDWGDEEEEMGLDPLNFVRERLKDERKWAKMVAKKYAEIEQELTAIRARESVRVHGVREQGRYCRYCEISVKYQDMKPYRKDNEAVDMLCPGCDSVLIIGE